MNLCQMLITVVTTPNGQLYNWDEQRMHIPPK